MYFAHVNKAVCEDFRGNRISPIILLRKTIYTVRGEIYIRHSDKFRTWKMFIAHKIDHVGLFHQTTISVHPCDCEEYRLLLICILFWKAAKYDFRKSMLSLQHEGKYYFQEWVCPTPICATNIYTKKQITHSKFNVKFIKLKYR